MTNEDREQFEAYVELEQYIKELQTGYAAQPPANLTPERTRIYRMAAFFHSVSPGAAEPSAEFVEALRARLQAIVEEAKDDVPRTTSRAARCNTMRSRECHHPHSIIHEKSQRWRARQ